MLYQIQIPEAIAALIDKTQVKAFSHLEHKIPKWLLNQEPTVSLTRSLRRGELVFSWERTNWSFKIYVPQEEEDNFVHLSLKDKKTQYVYQDWNINVCDLNPFFWDEDTEEDSEYQFTDSTKDSLRYYEFRKWKLCSILYRHLLHEKSLAQALHQLMKCLPSRDLEDLQVSLDKLLEK